MTQLPFAANPFAEQIIENSTVIMHSQRDLKNIDLKFFNIITVSVASRVTQPQLSALLAGAGSIG